MKKLRKPLAGLVILLLCLSLFTFAGCGDDGGGGDSDPLMRPGEYEVTWPGFEHDFTIKVAVDEYSILSITIVAQQESTGIGARALPIVSHSIVELQSVEVDGMSGATITSNELKLAVREALTNAGATSKMFAADKRTPVPYNGYTEDFSPDVIVVGGGLAGLYAALNVAKNGGNVLLLEQNSSFGGSSSYSGGAYAHAGSEYQKAFYPSLAGTAATYANWLITGTNAGVLNTNVDGFKTELATKMAERTGPALDNMIAWGVRVTGLTNQASGAYCGTNFGSSRVGVPNLSGGRGYDIIEPLVDMLQIYVGSRRLAYLLNTKATEILVDATGKVTGVKAEDKSGSKNYSAKAVILASGGFADNIEMLMKPVSEGYPGLKKFGSSSGGQSIGNMFDAAMKVGAGTYRMEVTRFDGGMIEAGYHFNGKKVEMEARYSQAGIVWLNKAGVRPENEWTTDNFQRWAVWREAQDQTIYLVFNESMVAGWPNPCLYLGNYATGAADRDNVRFNELVAEERVAWKADTLAGAAAKAGLDPATVAATIADYNANRGNRLELNPAQPCIILETIASVKGTLGGLLSNEKAEILKPDNSTPILGLYGAGEILGDIGSTGQSWFGGVCLTLCAGWGDEASNNALVYAKQ